MLKQAVPKHEKMASKSRELTSKGVLLRPKCREICVILHAICIIGMLNKTKLCSKMFKLFIFFHTFALAELLRNTT
jgi:hypothetical protein